MLICLVFNMSIYSKLQLILDIFVHIFVANNLKLILSLVPGLVAEMAHIVYIKNVLPLPSLKLTIKQP